MLVELDSLNWLYKDLYSGKEDSNLEIKSSMLSLRPKVNAIKYVNSVKITFLLYFNTVHVIFKFIYVNRVAYIKILASFGSALLPFSSNRTF